MCIMGVVYMHGGSVWAACAVPGSLLCVSESCVQEGFVGGGDLLRRRKGDLPAICDDCTAFAMTVFWVIIYNTRGSINRHTLSVHTRIGRAYAARDECRLCGSSRPYVDDVYRLYVESVLYVLCEGYTLGRVSLHCV